MNTIERINDTNNINDLKKIRRNIENKTFLQSLCGFSSIILTGYLLQNTVILYPLLATESIFLMKKIQDSNEKMENCEEKIKELEK